MMRVEQNKKMSNLYWFPRSMSGLRSSNILAPGPIFRNSVQPRALVFMAVAPLALYDAEYLITTELIIN